MKNGEFLLFIAQFQAFCSKSKLRTQAGDFLSFDDFQDEKLGEIPKFRKGNLVA
ncbi:hypothetical protein H6F75_14630 [Nodosilinea sp. FACHB-131]|uniref:hypothetical protein n=1 Tax=Cyanophyceae TaxID=3028117 RepID=UPI0016848113|nr:hypothetical protein [Nodosilinea sp. FACHB-131]MBD1874722.1 hypothetical protein [Nodosilinea sp. FACHB-131]